ncbi:MAG: helix-turn-helix transcriptional regulator [Propioniciclava sp.]|uniref:helix-turn-helix domain-containing protein n=1 Tax=Propioniciclava sp. TaxID=2038686 RepID=UPI0039E6A817
MPSPFHGDRLKALRTEASWSQAELAAKIGSDARQVSRYENNKVAPGLEAVIRMAQVFNVTVDYLLINDAERRPLNAPSSHVDVRLADLDQLTDDERATITNVIDAMVTKAKLRLITG